jgi:hypothetical protein
MACDEYDSLLEEQQYFEAVALGLADVVAGTVDHKNVADWLATWGTELEAEPPI